MNTTTKTDFGAKIASIINEIYKGVVNLGQVDNYIQQGLNTADFDINEQYKVRIQETKHNSVYYTIFRVK